MAAETFKIITPSTEQELQVYYHTRWEVLRKPWGQPPGTERSNTDDDPIHRMIVGDNEEIYAVGRIHFNSLEQSQIRYMGVTSNKRRGGWGSVMLMDLENIAVKNNCNEVILQSRDYAIPFYEANGYVIIKKTYLLFGEIQHYLMKKSL